MSDAPIRTRLTVTLGVRDWPAAMAFYVAALGAVERFRVPGGGVGRLAIDDADFWVAEASPEHANFSPDALGGSTARVLLIVADPAAACARAIAAGAREVAPVTLAHGWRLGRIVDPFGHHWEIGHPVDDDRE